MEQDIINQILTLRQAGNGYKKISNILNIPRSTVYYYTNSDAKVKNAIRQKAFKKKDPILTKINNFLQKSSDYKIESTSLKSSPEKRAREKARDFQRRVMNSSDVSFKMEDVFEKYGGTTAKCYLTGDDIDLTRPETYHFDHIVPSCKGGTNTLDNLGICTEQANLAKGKYSLEEFFDLCKKVVNNYQEVCPEQ